MYLNKILETFLNLDLAKVSIFQTRKELLAGKKLGWVERESSFLFCT